MLCGFIIIGLLQESTAVQECLSTLVKCSSLREELYELPFCLSYCQNPLINYKGCISLNLTSNATVTLPSIYFTRPSFSSEWAPVYILIDLAPLMIYLPLLVLFNVNLVAGPAQSFVFFYQALPAIVPFRNTLNIGPLNTLTIGHIFWGFITLQSPINDLIFRLTLPFIALQYCKLVVVLLVAVTALVLVKCVGCPCAPCRLPWAKLRRSVRNFREKRALKGTVLNGLCSIAILTYGFLIQQSFTVLQTSSGTSGGCSNDGTCSAHCTELVYFGHCHLPFFIVAVISLVFALLLPLLLLYYPCVPALFKCITKRSCPITCHKLAPVFDVFQSAYKPKLRFFAALTLFYRFVIWLPMSLPIPAKGKQFIVTFVFILILAIHCLVQPYSKPRYNYIETLYLVNLVIISMVSISVRYYNLEQIIIVGLIATVLIYLPIIIGAGYILWKCNCSKRCRAACCKRAKRNRRDSPETVKNENEQVPPNAVQFNTHVQQVNLYQD